MKKSRRDVITFKVDPSFVQALEGVENRSDFIRSAVMAALDGACPLCKGTGMLTPNQRRHWRRFSRNHAVTTCRQCNETHLVCSNES